MPHKDREPTSGTEERPSERRHRIKKERDPDRPHKSRSSRPKVIDPVTGERVRSSHRRRKDKETSEAENSMADLVPELSRTASAPGNSSRSSLPYPSFSKEHSKEAVNSNPRVNIYTPEPTDVGSGRGKSKSSLGVDSTPKSSSSPKDDRPPSPPETEFSQQRRATPSRMEQVREESDVGSRPGSRGSRSSRSPHSSKERKERREEKSSRVSSRSKASKASTAVKNPKPKAKSSTVGDDQTYIHGSETSPDPDSGSTVDSNVTSVAPPRVNTDTGKRPNKIDTDSSPASAQDSSPRTPTQTPQFPPPNIKPTPSPFLHYDAPPSVEPDFQSPQPPPPPPPPSMPVNIPRVDYLMQNGGLVRPVPKSLLSVTPTYQPGPMGMQTRTPAPITAEIEKIFGPFYSILDQYETVIEKNGSIAVATGYRSVARRLLDRLEAVFARDLSSESCYCVMCQDSDDESQIGGKGLGWGEVLEWVSGRRDLPQWPAFDFANMGKNADQGLGISEHRGAARPGSPIKMDPDIAEEFREHYLRQSKKTKVAVDRWLSTCPTTPAAPPQEVDDETLSFSVLTHLDQPLRPIYNALLIGSSEPVQSAPRNPAQGNRLRSEFMVKTGQALQRLYRLPTPPRDPESGIYLLKNPQIHNLLATLSGINTSEWEILTSGRFDGFLWSGAESDVGFGSSTTSPAMSRNPTPANGIPPAGLRSPMPPSAFNNNSNGKQSLLSRITSPFSPNRNQTFSPPIPTGSAYSSRNPTPASFVAGPGGGRGAGPVSNDEETEIAVLAEVERDIYLGMEALEDAFESLHRKAELVRRALRERGAGLSISSQNRRDTQPEIIAAPGLGIGYERVYTPGQGWRYGEGYGSEEESEWGGGDAESEIAPDDSASNISSNRHRRPKRRNERRTPAPVEEEDEGE